jgi:nuclear pore complex protein Nup205
MVLLLLWRHVAYYCESLHVDNPNIKVSTTVVLRSAPQPNDGAVFRGDAAKRLSHILNRLIQLNLVSLQPSRTDYHITALQDYKWRENQAYIEIMSRRIRETVGLQVEDEEVNGINV